MRMFSVTAEFKTAASTILQTKKFTAVFPYMNLINREGFEYTEEELNAIVQFMGEFQYNEVAELFQKMPEYVTSLEDAEAAQAK